MSQVTRLNSATSTCPVTYTGFAVPATRTQRGDRELSTLESVCACAGAWMAHLRVFALLANGPFFSSDGRVCTGMVFSDRTATTW